MSPTRRPVKPVSRPEQIAADRARRIQQRDAVKGEQAHCEALTSQLVAERVAAHLDRVTERPALVPLADHFRRALLPKGVQALLTLWEQRRVESEWVVRTLMVACNEVKYWRSLLAEMPASDGERPARADLDEIGPIIAKVREFLKHPERWPWSASSLVALPGYEWATDRTDADADADLPEGVRAYLNEMASISTALADATRRTMNEPAPLGDLLGQVFDAHDVRVMRTTEEGKTVVSHLTEKDTHTIAMEITDTVLANVQEQIEARPKQAPRLGGWALYGKKGHPPRKIIEAMAAFVLVGKIDPEFLVPSASTRHADNGKAEIAELLGLVFATPLPNGFRSTLPKGFRHQQPRYRSKALVGLLSSYRDVLTAPFHAGTPLGRLVQETAASIAARQAVVGSSARAVS